MKKISRVLKAIIHLKISTIIKTNMIQLAPHISKIDPENIFKAWNSENRAHRDYVRMLEPKQQSNLRSELLLQRSSQVRVLLRLTYKLNCHISLLVHPTINATVPPRCKFPPYEQLRHVSTPFFLAFTFDLTTGWHQILRPWDSPFILAERQPSSRSIGNRNLLEAMERLHRSKSQPSPKPSICTLYESQRNLQFCFNLLLLLLFFQASMF